MELHYAAEINEHLKSMEDPGRLPLANYLATVQTEITARKRARMVNCLANLADGKGLHPNTLYLTVSYIDRYLSSKPLNRQDLELLGAASMLIAIKYEETRVQRFDDCSCLFPPTLEFFCYVIERSTRDMVKMERKILKALKYNLGNSTVNTFLKRFVDVGKEGDNDLHLEFLASYLAELSLLDYRFLRFLPSVLAASAVFLARFTLRPGIRPWNFALQLLTGYRLSKLVKCIQALHDLQLNKRMSSLLSIRDKYHQQRFNCVSTLVPHPEIPEEYLTVEPQVVDNA